MAFSLQLVDCLRKADQMVIHNTDEDD